MQALKTLRDAAAHVDSIIDEGNDVHCLIFMSSEGRNRQVAYPRYSPLLVSAFNIYFWRASIACSAVSDAFSVMRRIFNQSRSTSNSIAPIFSSPVSRTRLQLPSWV